MYSWEEVKKEIVSKLDNPTYEQIATYIEKAYKLGHLKGVETAKEQIIYYLWDIQCVVNDMRRGMESE